MRIPVERQASPDDLLPPVLILDRLHEDAHVEPVQDMRVDVALLRVHGAHDLQVDAVRGGGLRNGHPLLGGFEDAQQEGLAHQVGVVYHENVPVGAGEDRIRALLLPGADRLLQVQGSEDLALIGGRGKVHYPSRSGKLMRCAGGYALASARAAGYQHAMEVGRAQHRR